MLRVCLHNIITMLHLNIDVYIRENIIMYLGVIRFLPYGDAAYKYYVYVTPMSLKYVKQYPTSSVVGCFTFMKLNKRFNNYDFFKDVKRDCPYLCQVILFATILLQLRDEVARRKINCQCYDFWKIILPFPVL